MPSGDAFLLDVAEPLVACRHLRDHWLPRLDVVDDVALASASRTLDRATYVVERARHAVDVELRRRARERAEAASGTVPGA